jgi:hypothetical protein
MIGGIGVGNGTGDVGCGKGVAVAGNTFMTAVAESLASMVAMTLIGVGVAV